MLADILAALHASPLATALRGSTWLYPLVNAGHIVGIALLFGAIAALDLRLMGVWRTTPVAILSRILTPVAATGFAVAAAAGMLLFMTKAPSYAASPLFQAKILLISAGIANIAAYHLLDRRTQPMPAPLQRLFGAISAGIWLGVIVLGRLVGYF
jgi:hypothetical protein